MNRSHYGLAYTIALQQFGIILIIIWIFLYIKRLFGHNFKIGIHIML